MNPELALNREQRMQLAKRIKTLKTLINGVQRTCKFDGVEKKELLDGMAAIKPLIEHSFYTAALHIIREEVSYNEAISVMQREWTELRYKVRELQGDRHKLSH